MDADLFDAWDRSQLAASLAPALEERRALAEAEAAVLAPVGSGPGYRVSVYTDYNQYPAQQHRFVEVYRAWRDFHLALAAADPAAIEVGLELLSRIDPVAAWPAVRLVVAMVPDAWKCLWPIAGRALARIDDADAFRELLDIAGRPNCSTHIGASQYPGGGALAFERLEANEVYRRKSDAPLERIVAAGLMNYLRKQRFEAAWPALVATWHDHPVMDLRISAGSELIAWGDSRSLDIFQLRPNEADRWRVSFAVRAALKRDVATAIEQLGGAEALQSPDAASLAAELLDAVGRDAASKRSLGYFEKDSRFLDLALRWVGDKAVKDVSQWVISAYPPEVVRAARKQIKGASKKPRRARVNKKIIASMSTSRANLERIVEVLVEQGYQFLNPEDVLFDPDPTALQKLLAVVGPLPRALEAAYQEIGGCDLRGSHPEWPRSACLELPGAGEPVWMTDPFVLIPAADLLEEALEHSEDDAQWSLPIAPDDYGKAGFSGGVYTMLVPDGAADASVEGAPHGDSLVNWLRHVFAWGGFPGFATIDDAPTEFLRHLRDVVVDIQG